MKKNNNNMKTLYTYRFIPEGFNQVWANSKKTAIHEAMKEFPSLDIDVKSFVALRTKREQETYFTNLPLMD